MQSDAIEKFTTDVRKHENFHLDLLSGEGDLIVYAPACYNKNPNRRYPVLYLQDGQSLFDPSTSYTGLYRG